MTRDYGPRFYRPDEIEFKNHWAAGFDYVVPGSKDNIYTVKFTEKGITCDCIGMSMRGKCKHTAAVADRFCNEPE